MSPERPVVCREILSPRRLHLLSSHDRLTHIPTTSFLVIHQCLNNNTGDARSKEYCERIVKELDYMKDLPPGCQVYPTVVKTLESKEKARLNPYAGMSGSSRARQATRQGHETHAQVQRRLTRMGERRFSNKQK